jgi:hypothetical protein
MINTNCVNTQIDKSSPSARAHNPHSHQRDADFTRVLAAILPIIALIDDSRHSSGFYIVAKSFVLSEGGTFHKCMRQDYVARVFHEMLSKSFEQINIKTNNKIIFLC